MSDSADELVYLDDDYESTDEDFTHPRREVEDSSSVDSFVDFSLPLDQILSSMNRTIAERLDGIESSVDVLDRFCFALERKVETLSEVVRETTSVTQTEEEPKPHETLAPNNASHVINTSGSKLTLVPLNSEEDFPDGTWLGDETNPEARVRCQISPPDLLHVNTTCHTAEKMALTLMDCLFDRETQACSNISGTGKHKKKQLDPQKIYGIRCHLVHKFGIKDKDWQRIKQNMDSKCRTAFRRKQKGMPLHQFREKMSQFSALKTQQSSFSDAEKSDDQSPDSPRSHVLTLQPGTITLASQSDFTAMVNGAQVIQTVEGEIQILHATAEQLAEMERSHEIHILTGSQVLLPDKILHQVEFYKENETGKENDDVCTTSETDFEDRLQQE